MKTQQNKPQETWDNLAGEHKFGDVGQIVLACVFTAVWSTDTFFLNYSTFLNRYLPLTGRVVLGAVVLGLSGHLARTGLSIVFGQAWEKPELMRKSAFGVVRHPIYLGEILLYLGLLILSLSLAATLVWLMAIGFLYYISRYEERLLLAQFGEAYQQYMRDVPMFIPRLRR